MNCLIIFITFFFLSIGTLFVENIKIKSNGINNNKNNNGRFEYNSIESNSSWNQITINSSTWLKFVINFANLSQWTSIIFFFSNHFKKKNYVI